MKVFLTNYENKEPFDVENCKDCKYNILRLGIACSNSKATGYIHHNLRCKEYRSRRTQGKIDMELM